MVEAAMEFVHICEELNFYDIVLSMKASNTKTMIQACRLLQNKMIKQGIIYPQHLGITEAGQGDDARIKSAIGIGALLEDGIGNTIRVSLTEEPELEIPVAKTLINRYSKKISKHVKKNTDKIIISPFLYKKRKTFNIKNIGNKNVPVVIADISDKNKTFFDSEKELKKIFKELGYNKKKNKWLKDNISCDYIYIGKQKIKFTHPDSLYLIQDNDVFDNSKKNVFPLFQGEEYFKCDKKSAQINFVNITINNLNDKFINKIKTDPTVVLIFEIQTKDTVREQRKMFSKLINNNSETPVIIKIKYNYLNKKQFQLYSSIDFATLLIDGLGDGIWIKTGKKNSLKFTNNTCFKILQATGNRFSQTEYISCPSCGRTQFDIEKTLAKIRKHTHHLKGLKIGIMGCIVNGPGEMNDTDYGYVGSGKNKITLYKKDKIIKKNIDEKYAVEQLINIIKKNNDWIDEKPLCPL
jgi:(E)-4-hydroxy-3-methylbut-2-enyl-diphosphate synthase